MQAHNNRDSSHARWSYRRRLESLLLWAYVQCHVWRQVFERNYFPLLLILQQRSRPHSVSDCFLSDQGILVHWSPYFVVSCDTCCVAFRTYVDVLYKIEYFYLFCVVVGDGDLSVKVAVSLNWALLGECTITVHVLTLSWIDWLINWLL